MCLKGNVYLPASGGEMIEPQALHPSREALPAPAALSASLTFVRCKHKEKQRTANLGDFAGQAHWSPSNLLLSHSSDTQRQLPSETLAVIIGIESQQGWQRKKKMFFALIPASILPALPSEAAV